MAYDPDAPQFSSNDGGSSESSVRIASMIGQTIAGNFRINSLIGAGAMGDVYRATQLSLQKDVAIKLLRRELLIDETLRKRFELEAKNASSLNHPNCIQIIDFGRQGELLFIAMEFLAGCDLSQLIEKEWPLAIERTVHIFDQVLAALEEAHEHGIVHRDLKPANVMLVTRRGDPDFVKVCDFGIAKSDGAQSSWAEGLTMKGFICGTPEYMSPEQARGDKLDGRSDLYAAGVVLYQLLTREVPFKSTSPVALLSMHLSELPQPPSLRGAGLDIPAKLEQLVLRAMEKDPNKRPQTATEFRAALREAVADVIAYVPSLGSSSRSSGARIAPTPRSSSSVVAMPRVGFGTLGGQKQLQAKKAPMWSLWLGVLGVAAAGAGVFLLLPSTKQAPNAPPGPVALTEPAPVAVVPKTPTPMPSNPTVSPPQVAQAAASDNAAGAAAAAEEPSTDLSPPAIAQLTANERQHLRRGRPKALPTPVSAKSTAVALHSSPATSVVVPAQVAVPVSAPVVAPVAAAVAESPLKEAQRLMGKGQYADACQRGEDARKQDSRSSDVYKFLGKCYMRAGDPARASDNYRKYLELAPNAPDAAFIKSIVK
jgi:eukaryotic-like serine/threonine-protein kinase